MVDLKLVRPEHLWYVVGVIATDGNLSKDGRHISITSKDIPFLRAIRHALRLEIKIGRKASGSNKEKIYGVLQFSDAKFYTYLLSIGLMPRKSLILEKIEVPKKHLPDFLRGVIDGDGNIRKWTHPQNGGEQWSLRIVSASKRFAYWLFKEMQDNLSVTGALYLYKKGHKRKNTLYTLKFGKVAAKLILRKIYYPGCLALERKLKIAWECVNAIDGWHRYANMVIVDPGNARVAELGDATDLRSVVRKNVPVRPRPRAQI